MTKIILRTTLLIIFFGSCYTNEEETTIETLATGDITDNSNCIDNYKCVLQVTQGGIYHHCNLWQKIEEVCDGVSKLYEIPEYFEPVNEEENYIEDGIIQITNELPTEETIKETTSENILSDSEKETQPAILSIKPVFTIITPCAKRTVPDQKGVCRVVFVVEEL